jgi:hypothetical protein
MTTSAVHSTSTAADSAAASAESMCDLRIFLVSGGERSFALAFDETVQHLRELVLASCDLSTESNVCRLIYKGKLLEGSQTLREAKLPSGACIHAAISPVTSTPTSSATRRVRRDNASRSSAAAASNHGVARPVAVQTSSSSSTGDSIFQQIARFALRRSTNRDLASTGAGASTAPQPIADPIDLERGIEPPALPGAPRRARAPNGTARLDRDGNVLLSAPVPDDAVVMTLLDEYGNAVGVVDASVAVPAGARAATAAAAAAANSDDDNALDVVSGDVDDDDAATSGGFDTMRQVWCDAQCCV